MTEIIEKNEFETFAKQINLTLFNDIVAFIASTRSSKGTSDVLSRIQEKCIWYDTASGRTVQEKYNFEYLGELLERYEERFENKIEDIRAIALALGYGKDLIEDNMIIGTQLIDFLSKIKNLAKEDIYLQGALYLYDNVKYNMYAEKLMNQEYEKTEDIIFVLSVFYDEKERILKKYQNVIIALLGKQKTISAIGNAGLYAWVIRTLYTLLSTDKKRDMSLLKALTKIPTSFQKKDTSVYRELLDNGYSKYEIVYLNYLLLYYNTVPKAIKLEYSMVAEKIAIDFCQTFINSELTHENDIYQLIRNILSKYRTFEIKCYGCQTIKEALDKTINIINPITFSRLYDEFNNELFSFNILDEKWDIVALESSEEVYEKIMDNYIYLKINDKEKIKECIEKYNNLTGKNYIESFYNMKYYRQDVFNKLVDKNIIILKEIFEKMITEKNYKNNHIETYINKVYTKQSMDFLKYLIRINKYSIREISNIGFELGNLLKQHYSYNILDIDRRFLSIKDKKILFNCIERFIFYEIPSCYFNFLEATLGYKDVKKLLTKSEITKIYKQLCRANPQICQKEWIQENCLSTEEIQQIREQKRIQEQYEKVQTLINDEHTIISNFNNMDKKRIKQLYNFCDSCWSKKRQFSMKCVKEYLHTNITSFDKNDTEMVHLMQLLGLLLEEDEITMNEVVQIINKYVEERG